MDPTYPLFPIAAMLGFCMSITPLTWHLEALNSGTCYFMIWSALGCLNGFINAVRWHGNALDSAPMWCDISIRITFCASVAIPLSGLCIARRLYGIASVRAVTSTKAEKRRAVLIDSVICVLVPLVFAALQYIVQGHRYDIFEDFGCHHAVMNTYVTLVTTTLWPLVIGLISAVYCTRSLIHFAKRQQQFNEFLSSNNSVTISRYFRLMALSISEVMFTMPLSIFVIYSNTRYSQIMEYTSWADIHYDFGRVAQYPAVIWRQRSAVILSLELERWLPILCAVVFFVFFGFAQEARKNYAALFWAVAGRLGWKRALGDQSLGGSLGHRNNKSPGGQHPPAYVPTSSPKYHNHKRQHSLSSSLAYSTKDALDMTDFSTDDRKSSSSPAVTPRSSTETFRISITSSLPANEGNVGSSGLPSTDLGAAVTPALPPSERPTGERRNEERWDCPHAV